MSMKNRVLNAVLAVIATVTLNAAVTAQTANRTLKVHDHRTTVTTKKLTRIPPGRIIRDHRTTTKSPTRVPPRRNPHDHRTTTTKKPTRVPPRRNPHDHRGSTGISFEQACQLMAPYRQFMIGANSSGYIFPKKSLDEPGKSYNLKGLVNRKFLQYEKQGVGRGINIGWTSNASAETATKRAKWLFTRKSPATSAIRYGEPLAIAWGKSKKPYIKYGKRNVGINLHWSSKPVYEWVILGGKPGTHVKKGKDRVIIFNLKNMQPLVRFDRTLGGDIGWPNSKTWKKQVIDKASNYVKGKLARIEDVVDTLRLIEGGVRDQIDLR